VEDVNGVPHIEDNVIPTVTVHISDMKNRTGGRYVKGSDAFPCVVIQAAVVSYDKLVEAITIPFDQAVQAASVRDEPAKCLAVARRVEILDQCCKRLSSGELPGADHPSL